MIYTSSKTGTLPPTRPVFPPWGTTAKHLELQYLRICETCINHVGTTDDYAGLLWVKKKKNPRHKINNKKK